MEELKQAILDVLTHNYMASRSQLMTATGKPDRTIRRAIRELRRQHYPIGNAEGGGYSFQHTEDLRHTIADLRSRALDQLVTADALEKSLTIDGQETMSLQ